LNAGTGVFGVENFLMPGAGATTLGGSFDLSKMIYGNLIDAAKGDDAFLIQLVGDSNGGTPYQRLAKLASFPPFTIVNGGSQFLTATMTDVPQTGSLSIAWSRSQFTQYKSAVNPAATAASDTFDVFPQPGGSAHGSFSSTPDVLTARPAAGNSDVAMTMSYGNPFPSSWPLLTYTGSTFTMSYTASGATAKTFDGYVAVYSTLAQLPSPIVPLVSPVQSPTIDGKSAAVVQSGISATPIIAWGAPSLGTPSSYAVYLYAIDNVAGATSLDFIDELYTKSTSITIPPGLLAGGHSYFVDITAFAEPVDRTVTPFQSSLPAGFADALSGPFAVGFPSTNPTSCKALLAAQPGLPDGIYIIDPDGAGAAPAVNVWCDMTTAGGGWTLCAWSKDPSAETTTWAPIDAAQSSSWYACHKYSTTPVEALARVANASTTYSNRYANVDFKSSSADSQYRPSPAAAPNLVLDLLPNEGACATASAGNLEWDVQTSGTIFGQSAKNGCSSGTASVFIGSSGAHTNGCWGNNQISPQIGYPCGGFGNFGVHLELWAR
ncbi:MAG: hypothetical protein JWM53_2392, partial [bacterium]|nr:hypothetical protein [bacterium]